MGPRTIAGATLSVAALCVSAAPRDPVSSAPSQIVATGTNLTVTTTFGVATFAKADLIGFQNLLTGETYLGNPSTGELANVDTISGTGQQLQATNWTLGTDPGTGATNATLVLADQVRTLLMTVHVDPVSEEIVVRTNASSSAPGVRDASWSVAGMKLAPGRLIVPAATGRVFDASHPGVGETLEYPNIWHAQMAIYEAAQGSLLVYSTDVSMAFKQLSISTRGDTTIDVAFGTEAIAPFGSAVGVPQVEWRLKAFAGDWKTAAQLYKTWLTAVRPPLSNAAHPWVSNIRAVVGIRSVDTSLLSPLAARLVPSHTLLYLNDWRASAYDVNYPDYTPRAGVASFIAAAHSLGFKIMLHTDLIGVSPGNADYAGVQAFQVKTPETLEPMGWRWELPPSTPYRFAFISPASSAFRALWVARVGAAVAALNPDALHLDISGPQYNDGNGIIEGRTYPAGSARIHDDIVAAFPQLALGGEGENDITYRYHAFAQVWSGVEGPAPPGHPIAAYLFSPAVQYYGHLSQPTAGEPTFKRVLLETFTRGSLPQLVVNSLADLDTNDPDAARLIGILQSWQTHAFQLSPSSWGSDLVRFSGLGGASASLTDQANVIALTAAGSTLFQIAHDTNTLVSGSYIAGWPAFDNSTLYGLDPARTYWLDAVARPSTTHVTSLPAGVRLGSSSFVGTQFAHIEVKSSSASAFDALEHLLDGNTGVRFQNVDFPLANGAVVSPGSIVAGGELRAGLFIHPPFQGQVGGETFIEYAVPIAAASVLRFAVGVADNATCTDGVTFRVTVNGTELWSQHLTRTGWHEATIGLNSYAGTTPFVRLISHPGPAANPNCDWSLWSHVRIEDTSTAATIAVPLSMAANSVFSGFEGDGLFTATAPLSAMVTNVPLPGHFTVFTGPGATVSSGTALATIPFQTWLGAHGEVVRVGSMFNAGSIGPASSGGVVKNPAISSHPPNGGRTVHSWVMRLPAGQPLRLGWSAGILDGATSEDGVDFEVRINGTPYWRLTSSATQWVPGNLDLTQWQGRSILVELVTDSRAAFTFDWATWADLVLTASGVSCTYGIPPGSSTGASGGASSFGVVAPATCPWSANATEPWITIQSGASGIGNGTVNYAVAPNLGAARTGAIVIAGQSFMITQAAGTPSLVANGGFDTGLAGWLLHATPDPSYIQASVINGVLEFYRQPPPPGTTNQATAFQHTGIAVPAGAGLEARFDLGNSSSVRKRISVLVLDHDFSDQSVCTFWLPPGAPLRTYRIRTHTSKAWTNAAIYFYAATPGSAGGAYRLDNVSLHQDLTVSVHRTDCIDPTAPPPTPGVDSATLIANGSFSSGLSSWLLFGQIVQQVVGGVFEFYRPAGTPSGVIFQNSGQSLSAGDIVTATFELGNSSAVRKRVTVLLHDGDFSDLTVCTFWLEPSSPLASYTMRGFATEPWANATLSVYPATIGTAAWIRLDNVALRHTPATATAGTECMEPGAATLGQPAELNTTATAVVVPSHPDAAQGIVAVSSATPAADHHSPLAVIDLRDAHGAVLIIKARVDLQGEDVTVAVSRDGVTWLSLSSFAAMDAGGLMLDLGDFIGETILLRVEGRVPVWPVDEFQLQLIKTVPGR